MKPCGPGVLSVERFFNQFQLDYLWLVCSYFLFLSGSVLESRTFFFLTALRPFCCMWTFSSCGEQGLLFSCGAWTSQYGGFFFLEHRLQGVLASVVEAHKLSCCGLRALECCSSSCGTWASLPHDVWNILGRVIEPVSPALSGGFLTTEP